LNGRLMIRNSTEISDDGAAVIIETRHAARIDVDLVTLELINEGASLQMSSVPESSLNFFQADIINHNGVLQMGADFSGFVGANEPLLLKVYRNGSLVGFAEAPNGTAANGAVAASVRAKTSGQLPGLIGCGVASDNEVTPFFALTFRHDVIFTATNGAQLQGNHVRIQPARSGEDRLLWPHLTLGVANVHSFTITGERTTLTQPKMDVVRAGDKLRLSWPHLNQPFAVEAGAALAGPFTTVTNDQEFIEERGVLTLPIEQTSGRFFRLRLSEE